jgi:N-methylhydantoinase B/oxoprolinase/acetone carboxylase alpha subunit
MIHGCTVQALWMEGAAIVSFKLVRGGVFQEEGITTRLMAPASLKGCSGSRNLRDSLSDLKAQVAANARGIELVQELIAEFSLGVWGLTMHCLGLCIGLTRVGPARRRPCVHEFYSISCRVCCA